MIIYVTGSILTNAPSYNVHTVIINGRVIDIQIKMAAETEVGSRIGFTAHGSGYGSGGGVASARHVSGLPVNNAHFTFDAPLGPSVVRMNFQYA